MSSPAAGSSSDNKAQQFWEKLKYRTQKDPVVFGFLGLTVLALTRGLAALAQDDKRKSQSMMRYRVLFQLCTLGAVVGGVYYRAYQGIEDPSVLAPPSLPATDKRVFLKDPRIFSAAEIAAASSGATLGVDLPGAPVSGVEQPLQ